MPEESGTQQMQSPTCSSENLSMSIAVDFGGTKISVARIAENQVVERRQEATDQDAPPETHLQTIVSLIEALKAGQGANLGVAVCGRVDRRGYWHALNNNTLRGFQSFPLRDKLQSHFGCPVNVMNDATAAAWGEYRVCAGTEKVDSLLYITVSTGVGGGLVLNGRPMQSADGLATHLGFMSSPYGSELCGSGRIGTIESVASGTAIGRAASPAAGKPLTGYDVFKAHLSGDASATAAVDRSARAIAKAIADVRALLGIQLVTIGGSVGLAKGYIERVQRYIDEEPELFRPRVIPAQLGADSALFGVIR